MCWHVPALLQKVSTKNDTSKASKLNYCVERIINVLIQLLPNEFIDLIDWNLFISLSNATIVILVEISISINYSIITDLELCND